jgi:coatomer protein complex subunit gamma
MQRAESTFSLSALESKLVSYITSSTAAEKPFDVVSIPKISKEQARQEAQRARNESFSILPSAAPEAAAPDAVAGPSTTAAEAQSRYAEQLQAVPDFADYGEVLKSSSKPVELTESETEYVVTCVKHIFKDHIVFQVRAAGN